MTSRNIPTTEYSKTLNEASTMRPMPRTLPTINQKYPMHTVTSQSRVVEKEDRGLTFSVEKSSETPAAQAEYEVLKAILSRENYLSRLHDAVRTIGKKFKPEVADILDFVRTSSLEVIQAIQNWRAVKGDPDATFVWNGLNYLLKMPSDLDYLADYLAIQKWMGFPLTRNPFCVPYAMEASVDEVTAPQNIDMSNPDTLGYIVGGRKAALNDKKSSKGDISDLQSPYASRKKSKSSTEVKDKSQGTANKRDFASFIFNEDMKKIRHAESVILASEAKFGVFSRDPQGRLVPIVQALTRKAEIELKKDDKRPLSEQATSSLTYAPHAANSDIGVAHASWTPDAGAPTITEEKSEKPRFLEEDPGVNPRLRGEGKSGGLLADFETKAAEQRGRKPIKASLSSMMDFRRQRNIKSLGDRIQEIQDLKAELEAAKQALAEEDSVSSPAKKKGGLSAAKLQVIRSALSNNVLSSTKSAEELRMIPPAVEKYSYGKPADRDQLLAKLMRSANATNNKISLSKSEFISSTTAGNNDKSLKDDENELFSPAKTASALYQSTSSTQPSTPKALTRNSSKRSLGDKKSASFNVSFAEFSKDEENDVSIKESRSIDESVKSIQNENDELFSQAKSEIEKDLHQLGIEETASIRKMNYFISDQKTVDNLKVHERATRSKERSRDIERKRRLLTEEEGRRTGPPPDEENNVYDFYASRVQSLIRGWLARCWVKWYRANATRACIVMQSALRGWFGRMRVRRIRKNNSAATMIQKNFRGWRERGTSVNVAKQRNLMKKAIIIQRIWRGILGKKRANSKRALDKAAKDAFEAVDAKSLVASDVKELARRLIYAIEEPSTTTFPPDEVLHLIRLSVMVIHSCRGSVGLTEYDFFNIRHYQEYSGPELTWELAAKMVNRSERFIRLIRAVAYGPGAKPPRLLQLSTEGNLLYAAMSQNPLWKIQTFESMGLGSRICCQLFKWLTSVVEIAIRQQEFLSLIATSFPDWLPKLNSLQVSMRSAEFEFELHKRCYAVLSDHAELRKEDEEYMAILDKELKLVKRTINDARSRSKELAHEIGKIKNDQSSREVVALQAMEEKCIDADLQVKEYAKQFQEFAGPASQGDRRAIEKIAELKHLLTNQKLKANELQAQKKLLEIQVESNRLKRKDPAALPPDILARTLLGGETKAAYLIASVDTRAMLKSAGVKDASDLPMHLYDIYENLAAKELEIRLLSRQRFNEADGARKSYDDAITREIQAQDVKEQKSKDQMLPTDAELEEERLENEKEAILERVKHMQYIPDSVLYDIPKRPRPIIIAFSRDLAGYLKKRIHYHVSTLMPGLFVYLNEMNQKKDNKNEEMKEKNDNNNNNNNNQIEKPAAANTMESMGFDIHAMQTILNSNKNIVMNVDHGLTRVTRDSFLKNLEIVLNVLYPKPVIYLAVGDEKNTKSDLDCNECGVIAEDMNCLRDSKIKICLEYMSWCCIQIIKPEIYKYAQVLATDLVPKTKSLGIVLEAYFIFFSNDCTLNNEKRNDSYNFFHLPNLAMPTMIWQRTRQILMNLTVLYNQMSTIRRGDTPMQVINCLREYTKHQFWPKISDECRINDLLLHSLATWIERFIECELTTLEYGGMPLQSFSKSTLRGIQCVVTVKDAIENLPKGLVVSFDRNYSLFHWKQCSFNIIRNALQDLRCLKTVIKMNNHPYTVCVYREQNIIYFETYDSTSSEILITSITSDMIPSLIIPNGYERKLNALNNENKEGESVESTALTTTTNPAENSKKKSNPSYELLNPPQTSLEMYERLIKLLKVKPVKDIKGNILFKQLICQRDYILLNQIVIKIDGYQMILKCYESAFGELYFNAYLSEYSLNLSCHFSLQDRMILMKNVDKKWTKEDEVIMINEARPLLPYIIDRLHLYPSRTMYSSMLKGGGLFQHVYEDNRKKEINPTKTIEISTNHGNEKKIVVSNLKSIIQNPNIKDISYKTRERKGGQNSLVNMDQRPLNNKYLGNIPSNFVTLGLKVKAHGKAGKVIYRRIIRIYDIIFHLLIKLSTPLGIVIVYLYEPDTRKTLELRIPPFLRKILLDRMKTDMYGTNPSSTGNESGAMTPRGGQGNVSTHPGGYNSVAGKFAALLNAARAQSDEPSATNNNNKNDTKITTFNRSNPSPTPAVNPHLVGNPRYNNVTPTREWTQHLVSLLKVQWNNSKTFAISLNQSLLKRVITLPAHPKAESLAYDQVNPGPKLTLQQKNQRFRLLFHLIILRENALYLELNDISSSTRFGIELSRELVFAFLFHKSNAQILENEKKNRKLPSSQQEGSIASTPSSNGHQSASTPLASTVTRPIHYNSQNANLFGIINQIESEMKVHVTNISSTMNDNSLKNITEKSSHLSNQEEEFYKQTKFEEILLNSDLLHYLVEKIASHLIVKNQANVTEGFKTIYFPQLVEIPQIPRDFVIPVISSANQFLEEDTPPALAAAATMAAGSAPGSVTKGGGGSSIDGSFTSRSLVSHASSVTEVNSPPPVSNPDANNNNSNNTNNNELIVSAPPLVAARPAGAIAGPSSLGGKEATLKELIYDNMKTFILKKRISKQPVYEYDIDPTSKESIVTNMMSRPSTATQLIAIHDETPPPTKADVENPLYVNKPPNLNNPNTLNLSTGSCESVLRTRLQGPIINLEYELNLLAVEKAMEANRKKQEHEAITSNLAEYMTSFNNMVVLQQEIFDTTYQTAKDMLSEITTTFEKREEERMNPGKTQQEMLDKIAEEEALQKELLDQMIKEKGEAYANMSQAERDELERNSKSEEHAIVNDQWKKILELGCKVNFREGKVTWHGHVSIAIEEDLCWISDFGLGKRYKFIVYEPNVSQHFEGIIRSTKHLKEVLGVHGIDLLIPNKQKEMLIFICRYRLEVVVNKKTWDGADVEPGAPPYRIEFQSDRLYTHDKITPVNASEATDEKENEDKLFEIDNARGKKIIRLVRRISGLLMQLTVFELPAAVAESALLARPVKGLFIQKNKEGGIESVEAEVEDDGSTTNHLEDNNSQELKKDNPSMTEDGNTNQETTTTGEEEGEDKKVKFNIPKPNVDPEAGPIEERKNLKYLKRYLPPAFRIVGYDPKSRRKVTLGVEPQAVIEVCGGIFSPYLQPERRRELARIVSESLILYFPNTVNKENKESGNNPGGENKPTGGGLLSTFELMIPWSGSSNNQALNTIDLKGTADKNAKKKRRKGGDDEEDEPTISNDLKATAPRTAAARVMNRKGRIFRSVLRISNYELIVSIYQFSVQNTIPIGDTTTPITINNSIIVNFYSPACTEAKEIILSEEQQLERISATIISFQEGAIRTAAIRRLMRFFKAEIIEDIIDNTIRELHVVLLPPGKGFVSEYQNITKPLPNENIRPSGLTSLFWPLDTVGIAIHRCGKTLIDRNNVSHQRDFLITIYTKSIQEFVERGLIIKLYDRLTCNYSVLHLSPSELIRICNYYHEENLLNDIVNSKIHEESYQIDEIETGFKEFTEKGILEKKTNDLVKMLIKIIIKDLGFFMSPQETIIPYMKSSPKGIFPE